MRTFGVVVSACGTLGLSVAALGGLAESWNQFRGPNGSGVAANANPPTEIHRGTATWVTPLPAGKSSPILWTGKALVTAIEEGRLVTIAISVESGVVLWKRRAPEVSLAKVYPSNSVASSTPCVDGEGIYVYFGSYGLLCYSQDGEEKWKCPIPTPETMYGVSTSPIIHENRVILVLDDDANLPNSKLSRSKVLALDAASGELLWETARPYNRGVWTTPMIWKSDADTDLVVLGNDRVCGYDPITGDERWYVRGFAREPIAVPVASNELLYVSVSMQGGRGDAELDPEPFWTAMLQFDDDGDGRIGSDEITEHFTIPFRPELPVDHPGFGAPLPREPEQRRARQRDIFGWRDKNDDGYWTHEEFTSEMRVGRGRPNLAAIRPGGRGDVSETHQSWNLRRGIPEIPSPIFYKEFLYLIRDGGVLSCVRGDSGEMVYRERLDAPGQYSASPVIADDSLYLVSRRGVVTVVKTGQQFEVIQRSELGESVDATPALDGDTVYIRTESALLAFRQGE